MITTLGKRYIKRYLVGQVPAFASSMALGIGSTADALGDQRLAFEVARVPISLRAYDSLADKLIFKAQIPEEYIGKISEIGLYSLHTDTLTDLSAQVITSFDQSEGWATGTGSFSWNSTNTRLGTDSLRFALPASASYSALIPTALDLSGYSPNDVMSVAYNATTNAASISVTLFTDSSNYFTATFSPTTGYNIANVLKSAFVSTGAPTWSNITQIRVTAVAGSGGSSTVDLDGIGFYDNDYLNPDLVMIVREVITPITKVENSVNEIEFSLGVSV